MRYGVQAVPTHARPARGTGGRSLRRAALEERARASGCASTAPAEASDSNRWYAPRRPSGAAVWLQNAKPSTSTSSSSAPARRASPAPTASRRWSPSTTPDGTARARPRPLEVSIAVIEKGEEIGSHALSGAVVDPRALASSPRRLARSAARGRGQGREAPLADLEARDLAAGPAACSTTRASTSPRSASSSSGWRRRSRRRASTSSPASRAARCCSTAIASSACAPATSGLDKHGKPKANFEPGVDIRTKVAVLGEGPRGTLAKQLEQSHGLMRGKQPAGLRHRGQGGVGGPPGALAPGDVVHTMGWPLDLHTFGGGFVYGMKDDLVIVGLVVGLDYRNPLPRSAPGVPALQDASRDRALLRGGKMHVLRRQGDPRGRLLVDAEALGRRLPRHRRQRRASSTASASRASTWR